MRFGAIQDAYGPLEKVQTESCSDMTGAFDEAVVRLDPSSLMALEVKRPQKIGIDCRSIFWDGRLCSWLYSLWRIMESAQSWILANIVRQQLSLEVVRKFPFFPSSEPEVSLASLASPSLLLGLYYKFRCASLPLRHAL